MRYAWSLTHVSTFFKMFRSGFFSSSLVSVEWHGGEILEKKSIARISLTKTYIDRVISYRISFFRSERLDRVFGDIFLCLYCFFCIFEVVTGGMVRGKNVEKKSSGSSQ